MKEYVIDVALIEELQATNNVNELDLIFERAKKTIVNGVPVFLVRRLKTGTPEKFEELTTLPDLEEYKKRVFRYL
ncbi:MAG: hypothetical protein ACXVMS_01940 [Flavisolibacter sp.]